MSNTYFSTLFFDWSFAIICMTNFFLSLRYYLSFVWYSCLFCTENVKFAVLLFLNTAIGNRMEFLFIYLIYVRFFCCCFESILFFDFFFSTINHGKMLAKKQKQMKNIFFSFDIRFFPSTRVFFLLLVRYRMKRYDMMCMRVQRFHYSVCVPKHMRLYECVLRCWYRSENQNEIASCLPFTVHNIYLNTFTNSALAQNGPCEKPLVTSV